MRYEELEFSYLIVPSRYFSCFLLFLLFLLILYTGLNAFLSICYHVWSFKCYIALLSCYHSDYIVCSCDFRLSVYTQGIHLMYIHYRLLSRLYFQVFLKAGRDNGFGNLLRGIHESAKFFLLFIP